MKLSSKWSIEKMKVKLAKKGKLSTALFLRKVKSIKKEKDHANDTEENQVPAEKIQEDELDDIFGEIKQVKKENKEKMRKKQEAEAKKPTKRRYTSDGLPIYTEEELKINNPNAGNTPLCPFDCDCCF